MWNLFWLFCREDWMIYRGPGFLSYPPPQDIPLPQGNYPSGPASVKTSLGLQIWIRGHNSDTRWPWGVFLAKRHLPTRSDSWDRDQRKLTSALLYSASLWQIRKTRPGRYNQDKSMAGRYGTGVYIRKTSVPPPHSASTLGGDHTSKHIEKKHSNKIRGRTDCWEDLQAKQ